MKTVLLFGLGLIGVLVGSNAAERSDSATPVTYADPRWSDGKYTRGIIGGKHDLSAWMPPPAGACRACHVPHLQGVRPTDRPSGEPGVELFRITGQRAVFVPGRYTPGPSSPICLGCHDGTVATATIGSAHALLAG